MIQKQHLHAVFVYMSETERCETSRSSRESWSGWNFCDGKNLQLDDRAHLHAVFVYMSEPQRCFARRQNREVGSRKSSCDGMNFIRDDMKAPKI